MFRENITGDAEDEYFEDRLESFVDLRGGGKIGGLFRGSSPQRRSRQGTSTVSPSGGESGVEIEMVVGEREERLGYLII